MSNVLEFKKRLIDNHNKKVQSERMIEGIPEAFFDNDNDLDIDLKITISTLTEGENKVIISQTEITSCDHDILKHLVSDTEKIDIDIDGVFVANPKIFDVLNVDGSKANDDALSLFCEAVFILTKEEILDCLFLNSRLSLCDKIDNYYRSKSRK